MNLIKLLLLCCVALSFIVPKCAMKEEIAATVKSEHTYIPKLALDKPTRIPHGVNLYRSPQLDRVAFQQFITDHDIYTVIRLNGDGKDAGSLSVEEELSICLAHEVTFVNLNISKAGKKQAAQICADYLDGGNVLIHCLHGYDRTGAMVGYYLQQNGFTREQIIQANDWSNYLQRKGDDYKQYYDLALNK